MTLSVIAAALLLQQTAPPAEPTPTAKHVVDQAMAKAEKDKKNVYVMFTASWCGWCRRHYSFMEANKEFYGRHFEVIHLDVKESADKKHLENAGGEDYMIKWGGKDAGLPFLAVITPKGELAGNSMAGAGEKKSNIGHPWADKEVDDYMAFIKKSAPKATTAELDKLKASLRAQEGRKSG